MELRVLRYHRPALSPRSGDPARNPASGVAAAAAKAMADGGINCVRINRRGSVWPRDFLAAYETGSAMAAEIDGWATKQRRDAALTRASPFF